MKSRRQAFEFAISLERRKSSFLDPRSPASMPHDDSGVRIEPSICFVGYQSSQVRTQRFAEGSPRNPNSRKTASSRAQTGMSSRSTWSIQRPSPTRTQVGPERSPTRGARELARRRSPQDAVDHQQASPPARIPLAWSQSMPPRGAHHGRHRRPTPVRSLGQHRVRCVAFEHLGCLQFDRWKRRNMF